MENFIAYNPTKIHFGKDVINDLPEIINQYGKKVLLMYGKGSIKRNGIYDNIMQQLNNAGAKVVEYSGIKPNPVIEDVRKAVDLGRKEAVDAILAVGGGSVIDSAKVSATCIPEGHEPWKVMKQEIEPEKATPVLAVLTLAATGTEMNPNAVVQNPETGEKIGLVNPLIYPKHSFLDPEFTASVPKNYTAYGVADLVAHSLEEYFGTGEATLSDRIVYSIINEAREFAPKLLRNLSDYELRAKILWASTMALNGFTSYGRKTGDWGVHAIGHTFSFLYDTPHGATLSIAYPAWMKLQKDRIPERIKELGRNLFHVNNVEATIEKIETFFKQIECPVRLGQVNIGSNKKQDVVELMKKNKVTGAAQKLEGNDYEHLFDLML